MCSNAHSYRNTALPDGLFTGVTLGTLHLGNNPDADDVLPLTVTVEKVGTDQVRAKVLAGAPFAVDIPVTLVDGTFAGSVTELSVAAGEVYSEPVTMTRTVGTTAAATVDVDLTTQPTLPADNSGYAFIKAATGLPETILPGSGTPAAPTNFRATPGDARVALAWDAAASDAGVTHHEYRYKTSGDYKNWRLIANSGPGETNASGFTVTGLANGTEHTFELRARGTGGGTSLAATLAVTPSGSPRIEGVAVTSSPGLDGDTYGRGERIRIEVTFDQPVQVEGDPEFGLDAGGPRVAGYESGSGTGKLVFAYTVLADDSDDDGIWIGNHNHATNRTFRLDGGDRIGNAVGDAAELAHDELGRQSGHKVDGSQKGGVHSHSEFDHAHSHVDSGKRYYTQEYAEHTHASHEHGNTANNHPSSWKRPGGHHHHQQEGGSNGTFLGPDILKHDEVAHTHVCMDIKPTCNQGANFYQLGDELGLPIEVTHAHEHSEPGHRYDWVKYFEELESEEPEPEATPTPAGLTATPGDARVTLAWNAPASDSGATHHEYRYKTSGDYPAAWRRIANSAPGGTHASGFTVTRLANGTAYTFELRAADANGDSDAATSDTVTPTAPPRITGVAVTSTPELDGDTYGAGDDIRIEVTFDQPVRVEGDPEFGLDVGGPRVAGTERAAAPRSWCSSTRCSQESSTTRCRRTTSTTTASGSGTTSTPPIRRSGWTATTASRTPWATRTPSWPTAGWARSPATRSTARGRAERTPIPSSPTVTRMTVPARGTTPRSMPTIAMRPMCTTTRPTTTTIRPGSVPASTTTTSSRCRMGRSPVPTS